MSSSLCSDRDGLWRPRESATTPCTDTHIHSLSHLRHHGRKYMHLNFFGGTSLVVKLHTTHRIMYKVRMSYPCFMVKRDARLQSFFSPNTYYWVVGHSSPPLQRSPCVFHHGTWLSSSPKKFMVVRNGRRHVSKSL